MGSLGAKIQIFTVTKILNNNKCVLNFLKDHLSSLSLGGLAWCTDFFNDVECL